MPEEINRVLTDQLSDLLFITERQGRQNLLREGIDDSRIHFVGNVMIDTLRRNLPRAVPAKSIVNDFGAHDFLDNEQGYAVFTLHRPSNVDEVGTLRSLLETAVEISRGLPVLFPMHPRTRETIRKFGLDSLLLSGRILQLPPMGYLEMLGLMKDARVVLTDSGGIQEETTALGVPCITLRTNTERPITVDEGTNFLAGVNPVSILSAFGEIMRTGGKAGRIPEFWDGKASVRIVRVIRDWLTAKSSPAVAGAETEHAVAHS
jgi:UDP-N-acetylglucosamine 2-epimerase (non-hydrolysing)